MRASRLAQVFISFPFWMIQSMVFPLPKTCWSVCWIPYLLWHLSIALEEPSTHSEPAAESLSHSPAQRIEAPLSKPPTAPPQGPGTDMHEEFSHPTRAHGIKKNILFKVLHVVIHISTFFFLSLLPPPPLTFPQPPSWNYLVEFVIQGL